MVRIRVQELARERGLQNLPEFQRHARIPMSVARRYWLGSIKRVDLTNMQKIARSFDLRVVDLIEETVDEEVAA